MFYRTAANSTSVQELPRNSSVISFPSSLRYTLSNLPLCPNSAPAYVYLMLKQCSVCFECSLSQVHLFPQDDCFWIDSPRQAEGTFSNLISIVCISHKDAMFTMSLQYNFHKACRLLFDHTHWIHCFLCQENDKITGGTVCVFFSSFGVCAAAQQPLTKTVFQSVVVTS